MSLYTQLEADELFDELEDAISTAAAADDEQALQGVLSRLEDLILEGILAMDDNDDSLHGEPGALDVHRTKLHIASGSVTPVSTAGSSPIGSAFSNAKETFILQKSLSLLPLLCRFPLFTAQASQRIIKLIVLVSRRLNPKELWLGLDSVVEVSRTRLEAVADEELELDLDEQSEPDDIPFLEPPDDTSVYLCRALLAVQIVVPRINVKKPEKFVKSFVDALMGCMQALQSKEVRLQVVEPERFATTLLLVNTSLVVQSIAKWAKVAPGDGYEPTVKMLKRLFMLSLRSLLPLCPDALSIFDKPQQDIQGLLIETSTLLGVRPFLDLEGSFLSASGKQIGDGDISTSISKEGCQSVSGTTSAILLSAVCAAHGAVNEQEADNILTLLPDLLQFVMEEEMDELLRSLLLDAVFCLAKASIEAHRTPREASNGTESTVSFNDSATTGLQTILTYIDEIADRPPLSMATKAPARKAVELCEMLILHPRIGEHQRDQLIISLLREKRYHVKAMGVSLLRGLLVNTNNKSHGATTFKASFEEDLFRYESPMDTILESKTHQWIVSVLNLIFLSRSLSRATEQLNGQSGSNDGEADTPEVRFLLAVKRDIARVSETLKADEDGEQVQECQLQMQLEILKDAHERAEGSAA